MLLALPTVVQVLHLKYARVMLSGFMHHKVAVHKGITKVVLQIQCMPLGQLSLEEALVVLVAPLVVYGVEAVVVVEPEDIPESVAVEAAEVLPVLRVQAAVAAVGVVAAHLALRATVVVAEEVFRYWAREQMVRGVLIRYQQMAVAEAAGQEAAMVLATVMLVNTVVEAVVVRRA